jgi:hypothetical protein
MFKSENCIQLTQVEYDIELSGSTKGWFLHDLGQHSVIASPTTALQSTAINCRD